MAQTRNKFRSNYAMFHYDFDPNGTDPVDVAWVDMRDFSTFIASFFRTVGTGALDTFSILGNSESDGSGTDVTVVAHAIGSEPDAEGDQIFLECDISMIAQAASDAGVKNVRYVTISAEFATGTDEGVITYLREASHSQNNLTVDTIA